MMRARFTAFLRRLARKDERGSVLVEFALLAPAYLTLLIGVLQVGAYIQNYNALRNLAADGARYAVVQYQRGNAVDKAQIETYLRARGISGSYNLDTDRLGTIVESQTSRIGGVLEMSIQVTYTPPDWLAFVDSDALVMTYTRPVFLLEP